MKNRNKIFNDEKELTLEEQQIIEKRQEKVNKYFEKVQNIVKIARYLLFVIYAVCCLYALINVNLHIMVPLAVITGVILVRYKLLKKAIEKEDDAKEDWNKASITFLLILGIMITLTFRNH